MDLVVESWRDYALIDTGEGRKLERFGSYVFSRPSPQAIWACRQPGKLWSSADATYIRSSSGGGSWDFHKLLPDTWNIRWETLKFKLKPTGFGHMGIFPEQAVLWKWAGDIVHRSNNHLKILNLFAYTGCATCAVSSENSEVCHVDGSKGVVQWASENAALNKLNNNKIRWIVDDVLKFAQREVRRGRRYNGIILDPPSFGRGPKGQVWKIDKHLLSLMDLLKRLLTEPAFFIFTCHSQYISAPGLKNLIRTYFTNIENRLEAGHLLIQHETDKITLPAGVYLRFQYGFPSN